MQTWKNELAYHGWKEGSFEGWYIRVSDSHCSLAVIIGISQEETDPHAFIQTIDTISKTSQYIRYPLCQLMIKEDPFTIFLGDSIFSESGLLLHLQNTKIEIHGEFLFGIFHPLKQTLYTPTIMGPFTYISNMECIHSLISIAHKVTGHVTIQGQSLSIDGCGYIEKDRGISFPKRYIWLQSNTCIETKASIFLAHAHIPIKKLNFQGFLALLEVNGRQYRFATYYGAIVKRKNHGDGSFTLIIYQGLYRMFLRIEKGMAYPLSAPQKGSMGLKVSEGLDGTCYIRLIKGNQLLHALHFTCCANEVHPSCDDEEC